MNDAKTVSIGAEDDKQPVWLTVTDAGVRIALSSPRTLNGMVMDSVSLRTPNIKDVRACQAAHKTDREAQDDMLFSSLAEIGLADLASLSVKDYNRVTVGYFRMVEEDPV